MSDICESAGRLSLSWISMNFARKDGSDIKEPPYSAGKSANQYNNLVLSKNFNSCCRQLVGVAVLLK